MAIPLRTQWLKRTLYQAGTVQGPTRQIRFNSTFAHLQESLPKRAIQPTFEDLSPQTSYRLSTTLADYLPSSSPPQVLPPSSLAQELPIPHHLVYFEPSKRASEMLPDGTNPDQSPGEPFVRRMWAGGRLLYNHANPLRLDGSRGVCAEFIRGVTIKGKEGDEKLFVAIERRLAKSSETENALAKKVAEGEAKREELDHIVRQRLWRDSDEDFGECSVLETRNIVFMRARSPEQAKADAAKAPGKILKPQHTPDYEHTITPDSKLLFRFSALTFNAHSIHLDPEYSREIEGHRNLLFHGPMSFVFLVELLQAKLRAEGNEIVKKVEYRNVAPLYCHEKVKFCGKRTSDGRWEIWAETPEGGIAVKGNVWTEQGVVDRADLGQ